MTPSDEEPRPELLNAAMSRLPPVVTAHCFDFLHVEKSCVLSCVCRRWRAALRLQSDFFPYNDEVVLRLPLVFYRLRNIKRMQLNLMAHTDFDIFLTIVCTSAHPWKRLELFLNFDSIDFANQMQWLATGIRASLLPDLEELALNGIDQRQFQARDDADFLTGALDALLNALPPCAAVRKQPLRLHQATAKPSASKVGNDSGRPADAPGGTGGLPRPLGVVGLEVLEGDPVDLVGLRGRRHDEAPSPTPTAPSPPRTATSTAGAATPGRAASATTAPRTRTRTSSPASPGPASRPATPARTSPSATTTASSSSKCDPSRGPCILEVIFAADPRWFQS